MVSRQFGQYIKSIKLNTQPYRLPNESMKRFHLHTKVKSLGLVLFKEVSYAHQGCMFYEIYSNIVKYVYIFFFFYWPQTF